MTNGLISGLLQGQNPFGGLNRRVSARHWLTAGLSCSLKSVHFAEGTELLQGAHHAELCSGEGPDRSISEPLLWIGAFLARTGGEASSQVFLLPWISLFLIFLRNHWWRTFRRYHSKDVILLLKNLLLGPWNLQDKVWTLQPDTKPSCLASAPSSRLNSCHPHHTFTFQTNQMTCCSLKSPGPTFAVPNAQLTSLLHSHHLLFLLLP